MSTQNPEHFHDRIVPPSGAPVWLTSFTAGAMAFLAVFALALSLASDRLATRWAEALDRTATIRISAPEDQMRLQTQAVLAVLKETPGISAARALTEAETRALLEPWFGPDLPLTDLPLPQLVELTEGAEGYDGQGLRLRLSAEAPGAVLDDHLRWRRPLAQAAATLRVLGVTAMGLIGLAMAAMITLAASAALAANAQVIKVLRLVGATDGYIARAFTRRFTLRAASGAAVGVVTATAAVFLLPAQDEAGGFLTGLGFTGLGWLWPLGFIPLAAAIAYLATRFAAFRTLKGLT